MYKRIIKYIYLFYSVDLALKHAHVNKYVFMKNK